MVLMLCALLLLLTGQLHCSTVESITHWTVYNGSGTEYPARVPGGIYSDLQRAGVIGDILYRFNDVDTRWVAYGDWVYEGRFNVTSKLLDYQTANLVFHGVDTVAYVELNDQSVGLTDNMFVRYIFDVKTLLKTGENVLKVTLESPIKVAKRRSAQHFTEPACVPQEYHGECHANQMRKMQASFGWDWGPAFPSMGLWKPVQMEFYDTAIIRSVATHLKKIGQHWHLKIIAYLETSTHNRKWAGQIRAELEVDGHETITLAQDKEVEVKEDGKFQVDLNLTISENVISLWWPNGYGDQSLYDLTVSILTETDQSSEQHSKKLQIGFRTIELVEEPISSVPVDVAGNATGLTFYFRVNDHPLFMKGTNWIPAHILPERGADRHIVDSLLQSAREAHMSMMRVWGGGVYESDYFYKRCDQLGILIWQDFLFACAMYPVDPPFLGTVQREIEQNVLRLQYHPSIAVWAGNNENEVALRGNWYNTAPQFNKYKSEYIKLYVDTIKPIVEELDPGRRYLVSSPSNGKESEKEDYIAENPYDTHYGDTHYYNYLSDNWDPNIYPNTRFASEYGFQSLPSLATMRTATKEKGDFELNSKYSSHRQHSPLGNQYVAGQIARHLQLPPESDKSHFEKFVFYSQISQAMAMKAETEFYRQSQSNWYTMGALYWQLNDVWQAPSWSGIEYGGKWKMLHYFAKSFFAPVLVSPRLLQSGDVDVYLINDRFVPIFQAQIIVDVFNWSSLVPVKTETYPAEVGPLTSKKQDIKRPLWQGNKDETFLRFSLRAPGVMSSPYNFVFPIKFKDVKGLRKPTIQINVRSFNKSSDVLQVNIYVDTIVLFLWLETDLEGQFEDNGVIVTRPYVRVNFTSKRKISPKKLENSITYRYYLNEH